MKVATGADTCRNDRCANYAVDVTLTITAPANAATTMSDNMKGNATYDLPRGSVKTLVNVYAPVGVVPIAVTEDAVAIAHPATVDELQPVGEITDELAPSQTVTVRFEWVDSLPGKREVEPEVTPTNHASQINVLKVTC